MLFLNFENSCASLYIEPVAARASKFTWCCKNRQSKAHFLYL